MSGIFSPKRIILFVPVAVFIAAGAYLVDGRKETPLLSESMSVLERPEGVSSSWPTGRDEIGVRDLRSGEIGATKAPRPLCDAQPAQALTVPHVAVTHSAENSRQTNAPVKTPRLPAVDRLDADDTLPDRVLKVSTPVAVREVEFFSGVNPSAPGNSLTDHGVRVAVEGRVTNADGTERELELSVGPDHQSDAGGKAETRHTASGQAKNSLVAGFSPEDALFRAKWGWSAYNLAKQAARDAAETSP